MQISQRKWCNGENIRTLSLTLTLILIQTLTLTLFLTLNLTLNDYTYDYFRRCAICIAPNTDSHSDGVKFVVLYCSDHISSACLLDVCFEP